MSRQYWLLLENSWAFWNHFFERKQYWLCHLWNRSQNWSEVRSISKSMCFFIMYRYLSVLLLYDTDFSLDIMIIALCSSVKISYFSARSPVFSHLSASLNGLSTIRASQAQEMVSKEFDNHQVSKMKVSLTFWWQKWFHDTCRMWVIFDPKGSSLLWSYFMLLVCFKQKLFLVIHLLVFGTLFPCTDNQIRKIF
jgi:hypothetical protein